MLCNGVKRSGDDEWDVVESLLPKRWKAMAWETKALRRRRGALSSPSTLLRTLLLHAVLDGGLRTTAAEAARGKIANVSDVAILKRLRSAEPWLRWIASKLCSALRGPLDEVPGFRLRALDSTTLQAPASQGISWRLHYTVDLLTLENDWHELTDAHGAELVERPPVQPGDVLVADKNFLRAFGVRQVHDAGGYVLVRLRWTHPPLFARGRRVRALVRARQLRVGVVGDWTVTLPDRRTRLSTTGRLVALKLPAPLAARAKRRAQRVASDKSKRVHPNTLEAAQYVLLFTTLPPTVPPERVLEWYRYRWQIELAFKRQKQLFLLGRLPHQDPASARGWIASKLVVALLLETMYRRARDFSPWAYRLRALRRRGTEPVALDVRDPSLTRPSRVPSREASRPDATRQRSRAPAQRKAPTSRPSTSADAS